MARTRRAVEVGDATGRFATGILAPDSRSVLWTSTWYPRRTDGYVDEGVTLYAVEADVGDLTAEQTEAAAEAARAVVARARDPQHKEVLAAALRVKASGRDVRPAAVRRELGDRRDAVLADVDQKELQRLCRRVREAE